MVWLVGLLICFLYEMIFVAVCESKFILLSVACDITKGEVKSGAKGGLFLVFVIRN